MTPAQTAPVFVGGAERTGTSLMFALLTSHPHIAMTRRTNFWRYIDGQFGDLSNDANLERCIDVMARYKRFRVINIDWDLLRKDFHAGPPSYEQLYHQLQKQQADRQGKRRWGDKSLMNERYAERIFEAFPHAKFIHMLRDPRDRYASVLARWEVRRGGIGAGLGEWFASVNAAEENLARWPSNYMIIRYEDLVTAPEHQVRRTCDFIGEEFADSMLAMEGAEQFTREGANSSYGKRKPGSISPSSIGKYTQVLSPAQVRYVDTVAKDAMERHRYQGDTTDLEFTDRLRLAGVLPFEEARRKAWETRSALRSRKRRPVPEYRFVDSDGL